MRNDEMQRWMGDRELVIGEVDDDGVILTEYRIQPGENIPAEALELMRREDAVPVPRDGEYSRDEVEAKMRLEKPNQPS